MTTREYTKNDFKLVTFDTPDKNDKRKLLPNPNTTPPNIIKMNPGIFVVYRGQYFMRNDSPSEPIAEDGLGVELRKLNRAFEATKPVNATGVLLKPDIAGYHPSGEAYVWQYPDKD